MERYKNKIIKKIWNKFQIILLNNLFYIII